MMIESLAHAARHSEDQVRDLAALFRRPDHQRVVRAVYSRLGVAVPRLECSPASLQQDSARHRRRPGGLLDMIGMEGCIYRCFGRDGSRAATFLGTALV